MHIVADKDNKLILDGNNGGRITSLHLGGKQLISAKTIQGSACPELNSGCYLMFPWVNRINSNPLKQPVPNLDQNGLPLHGMYVNSPRSCQMAAENGLLKVEMKPKEGVEGVPSFVENYTLVKDQLSIEFKISSSEGEEVKLPCCFGYHPFFQLGDSKIQDLELKSDITTQIKLNESLLPIFPFCKSQISLSTKCKYDNLFIGGSYVQLSDKFGFTLRIESDLGFWQIYTPEDGKRIAIEPMSFCGNLYELYQNNQVKEEFPLRTKGKIRITVRK